MEAQEEYSGVVLIRISDKKCYIYNYYRKNLKQGLNNHEIISLSAISNFTVPLSTYRWSTKFANTYSNKILR